MIFNYFMHKSDKYERKETHLEIVLKIYTKFKFLNLNAMLRHEYNSCDIFSLCSLLFN